MKTLIYVDGALFGELGPGMTLDFSCWDEPHRIVIVTTSEEPAEAGATS